MFAIQNILRALFFIILYFQLVDARRTMSIEDVLKIKNENYVSFYCKNDICVETAPIYEDETVKIPDKNGNITTYIVHTCDETEMEYNICKNTECNADSDCLSNKCINKQCTYNDDEPIIHCDDTYVPGFLFIKRSSYMHCGKAWGYHCKSNDECSSKICNEICTKQSNRYDENGGRVGFGLIYVIFFGCILIFVFAMGLTICVCHFFTKERKKINIKY